MASLLKLLFKTMALPSREAIQNKTILITGANTGLGKEAARHALALGAATVILGVRSTDKGEAARDDIEATTASPGKVHVWPVDLSSFASVKAFMRQARAYVQDIGPIHYALLNAGLASGEFNLTSDGWEKTLQVNVLSTSLMALHMLELLQETARADPLLKPVMTITASDIHTIAKFAERDSPDGILKALNDKDTWQASQSKGGPVERYAVTKLLDIMLTPEIAALAPRDSAGRPLVIVNAFTPGFCKSELLSREQAPLMLRVAQMLVARTVVEGSKTLLHAVTRGDETHGKWMEHEEVAE